MADWLGAADWLGLADCFWGWLFSLVLGICLSLFWGLCYIESSSYVRRCGYSRAENFTNGGQEMSNTGFLICFGVVILVVVIITVIAVISAVTGGVAAFMQRNSDEEE